MKRIILYIAASADGFIATADHELDWLTDFPITNEMDYGYGEFIGSVDVIVMGGKTYRAVRAMDLTWPYQGIRTLVVTRTRWEPQPGVEFITDDIIPRITALRNSPANGKDVWLEGGGEIIDMLLKADLVDEMRIFTIPRNLGEGVPLFPGGQPEPRLWRTVDEMTYPNGVVYLRQMRRVE